MKKIFLSPRRTFGLFAFCFLLFAFGNAFAQDDPGFDATGTNLGMPTEICTITSEPCIAWTTSSDYWSCTSSDGKSNCSFSWNWQMARYRCCVQAETGFIDLVQSMYKYIYFIAMVFWLLFFVLLGIGYSISGFSTEEIKAHAKTKIGAIIIGLMVLILIPWILKTVAPFIFR